MKKTTIIILFCVSISLVLAQETTEFNYDQLNTLPGEDVALALQQGANPALINDFQLTEAVRSDISVVTLLQDQDLTRVINQDLLSSQPSDILVQIDDKDLMRALNFETKLLDDIQVINTFEGRMQGEDGEFFIDQVNEPDNSATRIGWFSHYGIKAHKRAAVIGFTEGIVTTGDINSDGVTIAARFDISEFEGASVNGVGELILPDKTRVNGFAARKSDVQGQIIFEKLTSTETETVYGNSLFIEESDSLSETDYVFTDGGVVLVGKKRYEFLGPGTYKKMPGFVTISGEGLGVVVKDPQKGGTVEVINKVVGTVTYHESGQVTLWEKTEFHDFSNGLIYDVEKMTQLLSKKGACDQFPSSCIEYIPNEVQGGEMNIASRDSNKIKVTVTTLDIEKGIKNLNVVTIKDESSVVINDQNKVLLEFANEPVKIKGQPAAMTIQSLRYSFESKTAQGKTQEMSYEINRGRVRGCQGAETECKEVGMIRSEKLDLTPKEILQYSAMWAIRAADDERYAGSWGGKGEVTYASYQNDVRRAAECGENPRCKMPTEDYFATLDDHTTKRAFDCVGFQGEAIYQGTGRGYGYDMSTEGSKTNRQLASREEGFTQVLYFIGTQEDLNKVIKAAAKDEIAAPLAQEIRDGKVSVQLFNSNQERGAAMTSIPAGAPISQLDEENLRDKHSILKGFGTDSIESHVGSKKISVDLATFEFGSDRPYLVTEPKREENIPEDTNLVNE